MKKIRVLHFTTFKGSPKYETGCGIATYSENYLECMQDSTEIENTVFEISPYETRPMSESELEPVLEKLKQELKHHDVFHINHEFGLYWFKQFQRIVETASETGKKIIVTFHMSPSIAIKPVALGGLSPKNVVGYLRKRLHNKRMKARNVAPLQLADAIIVHSKITSDSLQAFGVDGSKIKVMPHPVYPRTTKKTTLITEQLRTGRNDIIFCISGFLHRAKGAIPAVKALKYLPDNYKLALIGGVKADSDHVEYEDKVMDLVDALNLKDRVYITGVVEDHEELKALIGECDVAVFPYDRIYYAGVNSGSIGLALSNDLPVIAYPTNTMSEMAAGADGAVVLCETFAYYELARELKRIDIAKQRELSKAYATKMSWANASKDLARFYRQITEA